MRVTVFGAGATGGFVAAALARGGNEVTVIARGPHLAAMAAGGLWLETAGTRARAGVAARADAAGIGPQDLVIVAVKATGLASVAGRLSPLVGPRTVVLFPQNGMPWWYSLGLAGRPAPPDLGIFRHAGAFLAEVPMERILGGVVYSANEVVAPGVVRNNSPGDNRIEIGALGEAGRVEEVAAALTGAGIATSVVPDPRAAVWKKLLGNMTGSVLALVTGNLSSISRRDPALREIYLRLAREGIATAAAHGYPLEIDPEAMVGRTLDHKPSLLQDYEAGRPMEVAEIVLAPQAFARSAGVATPTLDVLAAIAARLARDRGLL